jgi:predicted DNA binding CopG/RHH family protein
MDVINNWSEVPEFVSAQAEAEYWRVHRLDVRLMEESLAGNQQAESVLISMRMDPRLLSRLKRLARSRYLNYQSMMKQWVSERLEQELGGRNIR